ncbi:MAG: rhodanese-like domain-containing protein [Desulfocapsa sp.]|nr:rhodanese-like domain-containing protein [Desulfocapsa sp.]
MTSFPEYGDMPARKLTTEEVAELLKIEKPFILDVRPEAFAHFNKFIKNSFHLPLLILAENMDKLPRDRGIIITDSAAKQSPLAYKFLKKNGFQVTGVLRGGMEVWFAEGRAVEERAIAKEKIQLTGDDLL